MKERFKAYLERQFRLIAPTKAAMELRKQLLVEMLDKEQELRIKGITDDDLIYKLTVESFGDLPQRLKEFESQLVKSDIIKRKISAGISIAVAVAVALTLAYVIMGVTTHLWHPGWLIMLGGLFAGVTVALVFVAVRFANVKKYIPVRVIVAVCEVLLTVFIYLIMELLTKVKGSYLIFLAMVPLLLGVDTAIAFLTSSKLRWFELPIFVEFFCVMLYLILGLALANYADPEVHIWHPGWILCLGGVVVLAVEFAVFMVKRAKRKNKSEKQKIEEDYIKTDEAYWTQWDD